METSHKAVLNKVIFLLIFVAFIATITGSAAASSSASQKESCNLSVTRDGVNCSLDQVQIAVVDNGMIRQFQVSKVKIITDSKGKIKSVTVILREIQRVRSSSTDEGIDSINVINSGGYQNANVVTTNNGANINLNQIQVALEDSHGVITQKQVVFIKVRFTKHDGVKVVIRMRQTQRVR